MQGRVASLTKSTTKCASVCARLPAAAGAPQAARRALLIVKLHLDRPGMMNFITAFDPQYVQVNQTRHASSLIVLRERLIENWPVRTPEDLTEADFEALAGLGVEIVLLGTGRSLRFPHPRLTSRLLSQRIGLEVMDTGAACRTYNILSGEGRSVAAALIVE